MKKFQIIICTFLVLFGCGGDSSLEYFARSFGGTLTDVSYATAELGDGGYLMVGETASFGQGAKDAWVIRLDKNGGLVWQKAIGGSASDFALGACALDNGELLVVGQTSSFGAGQSDAWIVKLDSGGNIVWQKAIGGPADDSAVSCARKNDGSIIFAGNTSSFGSGGKDVWVVNLDSAGNLISQKTYGGAQDDTAVSLLGLSNGNFYVVANSKSVANPGDGRGWVFSTNATGDYLWQSRIGANVATGGDATYVAALGPNESLLIGMGGSSFATPTIPSNPTVIQFDTNGSVQMFKTIYVESGAGSYAAAVALDGDDVFVATRAQGVYLTKLAKSTNVVTWSYSFGDLALEAHRLVLKAGLPIVAGNVNTEQDSFAIFKTSASGQIPRAGVTKQPEVAALVQDNSTTLVTSASLVSSAASAASADSLAIVTSTSAVQRTISVP